MTLDLHRVAKTIATGSLAAAIGMFGAVQIGSAQTQGKANTDVTFTKDVAPILQRSCQNCHRPNSIAPMSLLSYQDVRPWARSIKERVVKRDMPPWFVDRTIGINHFKKDISLSDEEIATIAKWWMPARHKATLPICPSR